MASQQTVIAETIRAMKLAIKRRDYDSDSDTSIKQHSNRGNKLKRKAHRIRDGRLDTTGGLDYRKRVNHAGYQRTIIHENPLLFDYDGDLVDADDDYDPANVSPAEDNPFEETKLHELLMPLTSASALIDHPSLSLAYTSQHLTHMAENVQKLLQKERENLWHVKGFLQAFRGDDEWAPLEKMETVEDTVLLDGDGLDAYHDAHANYRSANGLEPPTDANADLISPFGTTHASNGFHNPLGIQIQSALMDGVETADMAMKDSKPAVNGAPLQDGTNGHTIEEAGQDSAQNGKEDEQASNLAGTDGDASIDGHAMTTRAKARTPPPVDGNHSDGSESPSSLPAISNFFLAPMTSLPDQTQGLPLQEADETRRMLLLYVQKQEEVIRGLERLLFGLLKADRLRGGVWKWCKAEGHVGEMSDGEDWYDKDEWGLTQDLVKGKEEEEVEDEGKRRGRRREGKGRNAAAGG